MFVYDHAVTLLRSLSLFWEILGQLDFGHLARLGRERITPEGSGVSLHSHLLVHSIQRFRNAHLMSCPRVLYLHQCDVIANFLPCLPYET